MAAVLLNRIFLSLGRGDGLTQLQHMEAVAVHLNWPLYVGNFEDERMPVPVIQTDDRGSLFPGSAALTRRFQTRFPVSGRPQTEGPRSHNRDLQPQCEQRVAGFTGTQEFDLQTNGTGRSGSKSVADNANRGRPDSL